MREFFYIWLIVSGVLFVYEVVRILRSKEFKERIRKSFAEIEVDQVLMAGGPCHNCGWPVKSGDAICSNCFEDLLVNDPSTGEIKRVLRGAKKRARHVKEKVEDGVARGTGLK